MVAHALLAGASPTVEPEALLRSVGDVFAMFGRETQDSGNVSYGVDVGGRHTAVPRSVAVSTGQLAPT